MNELAYKNLQNLSDFERGKRINQFEDAQYGNRDYDYAVAGLAGLLANSRGEEMHGSDIGKLPNHPTFSKESIYSSPRYEGGSWVEKDGKWSFIPSQDMMKSKNIQGLATYMNRFEPGVNLVVPPPYSKELTK
jgi:hypothetical protein